MRRLALAAAFAFSLAACGGGSTATFILQPRNPIPGGLYLQVSGPPDAAKLVALTLQQGTGLAMVPSTSGKKDCEQTISIVTYPVTVPVLKVLGGQKVTLAVYGDSQVAPNLCQQLPNQFPHGFQLVGGNRKIYDEPSSSMEPTLHCAKPVPGCLATAADALVTRLTGAQGLARFDIVVFIAPKQAATECGAGGTFVKRVIGLPGETVREDGNGVVLIRGPHAKKFVMLNEPYISTQARDHDSAHYGKDWTVPAGEYFMMGDNRSESCDSRAWGSVPGASIAGPVVQIVRNGAVLKPAGIPG